MAAVKIRKERHYFADREIRSRSLVNFHNFARQFMPQNAGVGEKGLRSLERVKVGATNTNAPDAQDGMVGR